MDIDALHTFGHKAGVASLTVPVLATAVELGGVRVSPLDPARDFAFLVDSFQARLRVALVHLLPALDLLLGPQDATAPDGLRHGLRPLVLFTPLEPPTLEPLDSEPGALAKRLGGALDEPVEGEVPARVLSPACLVQPLARFGGPGDVQAYGDGALGSTHFAASIAVRFSGCGVYLWGFLWHILLKCHWSSVRSVSSIAVSDNHAVTASHFATHILWMLERSTLSPSIAYDDHVQG